MSTLKLENIKHENSSSNNLVLDSDGSVTISGNVGIETNNPLSIFHIGGGGDANVPITVAPSTGGNAEFRNTSSTGSFTFTNANGSNERMKITSSGNLMLDPNSVGNKYLRLGTSSGGDGHILLDRAGSHKWQITSGTTNALQFYNYTLGAESMRLGSAGYVTMPYQPAFRVYTANNADITTQAIIEHDTKVHDRANNFNTSTHEFTAPVTGLYSFSSYHWHKSGTGGDVHLYLYVNGSNNHEIRNTRSASHGSYNRVGFTTTVTLSANDAVHVEASGHSGGELHTSSGSVHSQFSGYLIG